NFNDIQDPETRIQDQSILSMVFIAAAKLDFKIFCIYRVYLCVSISNKNPTSLIEMGSTSGHTLSVIFYRLFFGLLFVFFQNVLDGLYKYIS
ncbi:hypothetical protein D1BOALGB6SA_9190, partial [Olavius sp. associated proteobacterium Delta 1]